MDLSIAQIPQFGFINNMILISLMLKNWKIFLWQKPDDNIEFGNGPTSLRSSARISLL